MLGHVDDSQMEGKPSSNQSLGPWSIGETISEDEEQWRRGYYDKPRSWEELGPQARGCQ